MIEYFAVYDTATGKLQWKTTGPVGTAQLQQVEPGMGVIVMPYQAFVALPDNLDPLKAAVTAQVNTGAGNFRLQFITDVPGQQATYLAKEQEARGWSADADQARFPYLTQEAADTGQPVAAIAALVIATADQWRALDPKIEGRRRGATVAIAAATNIAAIVAAGLVDWAALLAPPAAA